VRLRSLPRGVREWMLDHISIRLRLALWYAALLFLTLSLFSLIVFTVAQNQLQHNVDTSLETSAQAIASTLEGGPRTADRVPATLATPKASAAPTPTARPTATPSPQPTPTGSPAAVPTATPIPTPVPTPDPAQSAAIQQQLQLKVPDVLGQLDLAFEVLNARGTVTYYAPNIAQTGLPINTSVISDALQRGSCGVYTQRQSAGQNTSLLRVWVQPIAVPSNTTGEQIPGPVVTSSNCLTSGGHVVGVVLVAKSMEDVNGTLRALSRILAIWVVLAVFFTSLGGWLIAGNGLRPIASVTRTARAIAVNAHAAGLGRRVGYRGPRDEVGELASTFDDMLAAIERVAVAQRRFVADASHELRAPLTTIKGSLEFLRRARDLPPEERAAVLDDAYTEAERMTILVNDLLLLARADAAAAGASPGGHMDDQMNGRREPVELDQVALDVFRHGRALLQARHERRIQLSIENLEPEVVLADPGQIRQLLLILLDNALKYTPSGGKVSISVTRQGTRSAISISDTGIGIEPEILPHIFERFYRGDQARERDQHGSGLGLAIAKWIVDAHHGQIRVESQPGTGSTFTVLLPASKRIGEQTSTKIAALPDGARPEARSKVAGAISPLARLAGSVSRPRAKKTTPRRASHSDSRHPRDGRPSTESGKSPRARRTRRSSPPSPGSS
jgi:two-component system OmpR family sensor kinase